MIYYKEKESLYKKKGHKLQQKKVRNKERERGGAIKQYYGLFTYHS